MKYLFLAWITFLLLACGRETELFEADLGHDYFPLEVGRAWEYQVDSITFDPSVSGTGVDSIRILAREEVKDFFIDHAGDTVFRVERFERPDETQSWQIRKVIALSRNARQAVRTEDNLRFIKLVFPLREDTRWDGNVHIDPTRFVIVAGELLDMFKNWDYRIADIGKPFSNGILNFDDVVMVSLSDNENQIEYRSANEVYARNIGLAYMEQQILDTQCRVCCNGDFAQCASLSWPAKAEKGFIVRQRLMRWE